VGVVGWDRGSRIDAQWMLIDRLAMYRTQYTDQSGEVTRSASRYGGVQLVYERCTRCTWEYTPYICYSITNIRRFLRGDMAVWLYVQYYHTREPNSLLPSFPFHLSYSSHHSTTHTLEITSTTPPANPTKSTSHPPTTASHPPFLHLKPSQKPLTLKPLTPYPA
jgi:hypothetical protein